MTQQDGFTGLPSNDCASHYRERSLHRKLNHVSTRGCSTSSGDQSGPEQARGLNQSGLYWFRMDWASPRFQPCSRNLDQKWILLKKEMLLEWYSNVLIYLKGNVFIGYYKDVFTCLVNVLNPHLN